MVRVAGYLDMESSRRLAETAGALPEGAPLVLDLSDVDYLSSSGIGEIVFLASRYRLVLSRPSQTVVNLLRLAEVFDLLDVASSQEEALEMTRRTC